MAAELSTQPEFSGVFAKLIPYNSEARGLFSKASTYMEQEGDKYHLQFVGYARNESAEGETVVEEPVESDTDYDTADTSQIQRVQSTDHFVLSLQEERWPKALQWGWRAGRGSSRIAERNVEFLLAAPRDPNSRYLAHIHMYFRFNRKSGMLMLVAGSSKEPVYYNIAGVWKELIHPSEKLLYQTATMLRVGPFQYELLYTIQEHERQSFFQHRNVFLEKLSPESALPPASMWKLHLDQHTMSQRFLVFETTGSGSFGWVNRAVDTDTGDPVVTKELRITKKSEGDDFVHEVTMGEELKTDFARPFWNYPGLSLNVKMRLLKDTLQGICSLHKMGIMHRDITRKNMLILSTKPPQAALCDYGKATSEPEPKSTFIGPIRTLAPEVWNGSAYCAKIDLWAWGYAVGGSVRVFVRMLESHGSKAPDDQPLIDLLNQLLVWNPLNRISADEALTHFCWKILDEDSAEESTGGVSGARSSETKRIRLA
ncbi:signal transducing kinase of the PAK [Trapelia coarctata]|nr:signal transducing kinase of the PAK [Trapelia coarctata]